MDVDPATRPYRAPTLTFQRVVGPRIGAPAGLNEPPGEQGAWAGIFGRSDTPGGVLRQNDYFLDMCYFYTKYVDYRIYIAT
jgi:hypothetical protein